ncbi:MAG TPA: conjugal transfer protein TraD, partial [Rhodopila sp.]
NHHHNRGNRMVRTLAERLRAHEQQKARLADQEAKLKTAERKARTRRLIEAGGLVDKAGLIELEPNALYGALLSLRDGADDKSQVSKWAALGGRAFDREARLRDEGKEAIVLTFPAALTKDVTTTLRAAGFRFSKVLQHWEGLAHFGEAEMLAREHGGAARRVPASAPPASTPALDSAAE